MIEKRKYQRNDLMAGVQYTRSSDTYGIVSRGVIKNYSPAGICLIASEYLKEGQEIIVSSLSVPSSKKAIVRWQRKFDKDTYYVGLEYIKRPVVDPGLHSQGTPDAE